jgi:hypothetical protein
LVVQSIEQASYAGARRRPPFATMNLELIHAEVTVVRLPACSPYT